MGGRCIETLVRRTAHELLLRKQSGILRYELDHDFGYDDGMICGGPIEVAVPTIDRESCSHSLGLFASTVFTLVVIPVAYWLLYERRLRNRSQCR